MGEGVTAWVPYGVNGVRFHMPKEKYTLTSALGSGSGGLVCSGVAVATNEAVAIKRIPMPDSPEGMRRVVREVATLKHLSHDNVLGINDVFFGPEDDKALYIVTPLLDVSLSDVLKMNRDENTVVENDHIKYFAMQILCGLAHIHGSGIMHRDVKPHNMVINKVCDLKIIDFGLARDVDHSDNLTSYVVTRHYRAPELLMMTNDYTPAIDMWSAGCVIAELFLGQALFRSLDVRKQLIQMVNLLGTPAEDLLQQMNVSDRARSFIKTLPRKEARPLSDYLSEAAGRQVDPELADLISKLLAFDPAQRITAQEALSHPYLADYAPEETVESTPQAGYIYSCIKHSWGIAEPTLEEVTDQLHNIVARVRDDLQSPRQPSTDMSDDSSVSSE